MPTHTKTRRVLSINGQKYVVAESVKTELLLQVLELFSSESLKPVSEEHVYLERGTDGWAYGYLLVEESAPRGDTVGLTVAKREVVTMDEFRERDAAGNKMRAERDKAREEAAKNASK